ncbi:DNA polymerase-3 subunit delta [Oikeobacillus pervagus]|uniref:DNA polymerase III subunit delta n=1 Tax=Oikeobacillus pervagus TaxID=1325931 RepID=A0AAJ1T1E2_9BACI|nr:DNA polymerase III subunit delta [Oikeobacillus pervagus]MDQ0216805.1 DNA polymerase-3 subunit delta [Oikeobacillus pervagus]
MISIWKDIENKKFSNIYLLFGKESFFIKETKRKLLENVLTEEEMDFNFSSYDLEETPIELTLEDAETLPFLGERRLVFLHNPIFLTAEKSKDKAEKMEHHLKKLEKYLEEPAPFSVIVFIAPYEKLDERKKLTKLLKKKATVLEAKKLNEQELKKWIVEIAKRNEIEMSNEAIEQLLILAGTDLLQLTNEVEKLSLYASNTGKIDVEMVQKLTSRSLEQDIFSIVDRILKRKIDEALRIYYDLLKQKEEPIKILAIIASQFRLIYQVKELSRRGYGQPQIAGAIKVHPFRVKLAAGQARDFSEQELMRIIDLLAQCDYEMKTSSMKKEMIIEMLLFKLHRS